MEVFPNATLITPELSNDPLILGEIRSLGGSAYVDEMQAATDANMQKAEREYEARR